MSAAIRVAIQASPLPLRFTWCACTPPVFLSTPTMIGRPNVVLPLRLVPLQWLLLWGTCSRCSKLSLLCRPLPLPVGPPCVYAPLSSPSHAVVAPASKGSSGQVVVDPLHVSLVGQRQRLHAPSGVHPSVHHLHPLHCQAPFMSSPIFSSSSIACSSPLSHILCPSVESFGLTKHAICPASQKTVHSSGLFLPAPP